MRRFLLHTLLIWPIRPPDLIGPVLLLADGSRVPTEVVLRDKIVILLFATSSCPMCKVLRRRLEQACDEAREALGGTLPVEVVLVSWDYSEDLMMRGVGDWAAIPFRSARLARLTKRYCVTETPTAVVLGPDGELLTMTGRHSILAKGSEAVEEWVKTCKLGDNNPGVYRRHSLSYDHRSTNSSLSLVKEASY
eukprot:Plantae.Rhodophyta-Rhodochaete_pulchella.ctg8293.p1 GENE.Plantae.Rhodophyta-Rhodochaete_pulchella.ctg8293~~Plantae.Rhodophyta-Rhodochaete_pulchella.ctg8293.p1  ORF type:complete len:193 (-),score=11.31 Plantae.Rhodophyta-Rhodochaete_pulchella.ctg8293:122-700(-)